LIVTPGDRGILLSALSGKSFYKLSKDFRYCTGGFEPEESLMRLIQGSPSIMPIICAKTGTFETSAKLGTIQPEEDPATRKIQLP
jgi:phosphate acetyltransferase